MRFETKPHSSYYYIDSIGRRWNTGRVEEGGNRGYKVSYKGGYFPVSPTDHFADLRAEMVMSSRRGLHVERRTTRSAPPARPRSTTASTRCSRPPTTDELQVHLKNVAWRNGKTATFMPKPIFGDNGSGMHCHQWLWNDGSPLSTTSSATRGLSDTARYYIGGLLKHAPSLLAFTNPTANSYHRLVPGFEAPVNLVYCQRNRSACFRIPITGSSPKAKRLEFRVPDPSCNPYLAFSAMLMAGLDGIRNKTEPPAPIDKDLYELPPEELAHVPQVPGSLGEVLDSLEADHEYLLERRRLHPRT